MAADDDPSPFPFFRAIQLTFWCPVDPVATLRHDNGTVVKPHKLLRIDQEGGQVIFHLPHELPAPFGIELSLSADGFTPFKQHFELRDFTVFDGQHDTGNKRTQLPLPDGVRLKPSAKPLPALSTDGAYFRTPAGPHTIIQATDFKAFLKFVLGQTAELKTVFSQRRDLGFNDLRVLSMCRNMFDLNPANVADYFARLGDFFDFAAQHELRVTLVVHADSRLVMPDQGQQVAHWNRCGDVARPHTNVRLSLVNEVEQTPNVIDPNAFQKIPGVLCSRGSHGGGDLVGPRPWWDWEEAHHNGQSEAQRKIGHNTMENSVGAENHEASKVPCESSESSRFPDQWGVPPDQMKAYAFAIGQSAALLCAGACFHSPSGKESRLFSGLELECATEWAKGARSVPLEFQKGQYRHLPELEGPGITRVYRRVLGDGRSFETRIPA
jgi:hypothetical protein